ncbi:MAG TPA: SagB/ThcOx family dehydrogenase [Syntrophales bacterium]|nr:SagB/ThcOx family dehydrogenase [Syntrophales bacterium]
MNMKVNVRNLSRATAIGFVFVFLVAILPLTQNTVLAEEQKPIQLSKPQMDGNPLMKVLAKRSSSRLFSSETLPVNILSNMLWAAFGINRSESGKRTAPSANNRQEIDIYVATATGFYLYDAKSDLLKPILAGDIRGLTGIQGYVKDAAVNLIYVADYSKMSLLSDEIKLMYAAADTGFISENVYLYCASVGLSTVVRAGIDRPALAKVMGLRPDQRIILAQSVGYPAKQK